MRQRFEHEISKHWSREVKGLPVTMVRVESAIGFVKNMLNTKPSITTEMLARLTQVSLYSRPLSKKWKQAFFPLAQQFAKDLLKMSSHQATRKKINDQIQKEEKEISNRRQREKITN